VGDHHPTGEHQFGDVPKRQREAVVQPDGVADDLCRNRKPTYDAAVATIHDHPSSPDRRVDGAGQNVDREQA
jgi:hypothetical protein